MATYQEILDFWFHDITPASWWKKDPAIDGLIETRFNAVHRQAMGCELFHWRATAHGRLAEIIVLDQFSRNIYRDDARAFAADPLALALAQEAVANETDHGLSPNEKIFLYMPYMHSESPIIHQEAVKLYDQQGLEDNLKFEFKHKAIIDRFGRYPHRNGLLGRTSTQEEIEFLKTPGSSF